MSAQLIDGREIAKQIRICLRKRVKTLAEQGVVPGLAVILAGDDPASEVYVRGKENACAKVGISVRTIRMGSETTQEQLEQTIRELNRDDTVHGILLQLPVYRHLDADAAIRLIDPKKDADGFQCENAGSFYLGGDAPVACTPRGCMVLLKSTGVELDGKRAVVIGRSNIVGKPMAMLLLNANCTVTVCHSHTKNLGMITREADILVSAVGKPRLITADMVKEGAAVIDVGINRMEDGSLCGDVDFDAVSEKAGWITPVPGGVGPMTIAMLLTNTVEAAERYGLDA